MNRHFEWDDLRIILAVARSGSVRGGAGALNMHHSSVVRRIRGFEDRHGVKVFDRQAMGYAPTASGEDILTAAEAMENEALALERQVMGRDGRLSGDLRVTMPMALATHLLMPTITEFTRANPNIQIELDASAAPSDLTRRDADIAVRVSAKPPDHLIGRRVGYCAFAIYGRTPDSGLLGWTADARFHQFNIQQEMTLPLALNDVLLHLAACQAGYGRALLPRFIGDAAPDLTCYGALDTENEVSIWILTHADLARTARVRAFSDHIYRALKSNIAVLEGPPR